MQLAGLSTAPMFPIHVRVGSARDGDVVVPLVVHADGTIEGDVDLARKVLRTMTSSFGGTSDMVFIALALRLEAERRERVGVKR